jgi:hypothetical protein
MMDHVTRHSQDDDPQPGSKPPRNVNEYEESGEGSYYYDDSSNYEVYRDEDDKADDCSVTDDPPSHVHDESAAKLHRARLKLHSPDSSCVRSD